MHLNFEEWVVLCGCVAFKRAPQARRACSALLRKCMHRYVHPPVDDFFISRFRQVKKSIEVVAIGVQQFCAVIFERCVVFVTQLL
jgi:hypothetical protein